MKSKKLVRIASVFIFAGGVLLAMALSAIVVWGDLEASLFDTSSRGDASLSTLKCPVLMTEAELGSVSAAFTNSLQRPVTFTVRTRISRGYVTLMREIDSKLPLAPGETQTLEWTVTQDDAAYGRLILLRVRLYAKYPLPSRDGSCGILVVDLPYLSGNQIFVLALGTSLLSIVGGMALCVATNWPLRGLGRDATRAMGVLAGNLLAGMVVGLLGRWTLSGLFFMFNVLLIGAMIGHFVNKRGEKTDLSQGSQYVFAVQGRLDDEKHHL